MKPTKKSGNKSTRFYRRLYKNILITFIAIFLSLIMGVLGYHYIARLSFVDALLNASMILTGMGPVDTMINTSAKIFASFYALFSGITFLTSIAVLVAPMVQRLMHEMNLETITDEEHEEEQDRPHPKAK
jgi:xanthine/uracil permease